MNILTFDIEEWFHILDFEETRSEEQWRGYEVRIYENVERLFRILEETNSRATFFIVGWIAKTYPDLVKQIAAKYQIGSHTMNHQLIWNQTPEEFREDVSSSVKFLEDLTGQKVTTFRVPGFSIRESEGWAFETLAELGITTDCSVFPAHHGHGGMPTYSRPVPSIISRNGITIREFPITTKLIGGHHIIFTGGGYFRLFPYPLIKRWSSQQDYLMSYIHPRDLDAGQPMLHGLPLKRKFKSYIGLKGAEAKLCRWLTDFQFTDVATAESQIDWSQVPVVTLE